MLFQTRFLPLILLAVLLGSSLSLVAQTLLLTPGDVVRVSVFGQPDLTTTARISGDGRITFPLIGDVTIGGLPPDEAEANIEQLLADGGFVRNAQVTIFIEERSQASANSVTILGQVDRSGTYPLADISTEGVQTVVDLLAMAGGTNENAADHLLLIKKEGDERTQIRVDLVELIRQGKLEANYSLNGGDIILVPPMDVFYIYGQVHRPGRYRLERDMTVMQAVSVAGGLTEFGRESDIQLKRRGRKGIQSLRARITDELRPDDVIYVD